MRGVAEEMDKGNNTGESSACAGEDLVELLKLHASDEVCLGDCRFLC